MINFGQTFSNASRTAYPHAIWNKDNSSDGLPVFLDCGTEYSLLPSDLVEAIAADFPGIQVELDENGTPNYIIPCQASKGTFDFSFGATTIKISYQDMLVQEEDGRCQLGFGFPPVGTQYVPYILGSSFMLGAYVTIDAQNDAIWLGESANCGPNVVAMAEVNGTIPQIPGCNREEDSL